MQAYSLTLALTHTRTHISDSAGALAQGSTSGGGSTDVLRAALEELESENAGVCVLKCVCVSV